jgi:hypothetical protein
MNNKQRKKWMKFVVTKVKLNPEQAVLDCCNISRSVRVDAPWRCSGVCGDSGNATLS